MSSYSQNRFIPNSPHNDRISKIQEKLNSIQIGVESERYRKFEQAESHLCVLEEQFFEVQGDFDKTLNSIRENLIRFEKVLQEERINHDSQIDQGNQEIAQIENKFVQAIESETEARKDYEAKVIRNLEDKYSFLKNEISKEQLSRNQFIDELYQTLQSDLPKIEGAIENEKQEREENDQAMMKTVTYELSQINEIVITQKKQREQSEAAIFDMLKDVVNRVKIELDNEKKTREETEDHLLTLLEETCSKLQTASQF
ncbi:KdD6, putative (macronuclear) [Tetrahymena thermophila SB210]|uniref:KdD6, putative n=1 Tax=Tetrahymena thermophila (strain SB210) TaxID=312017 RepID=I7LUY9_TETTS|nr:KdD6, putative [Tetrahymena thermophila SB210]EAR96329.1 KdD6, putative [Tetrahymena thermophila SB210]|eukprot:XP_001016574.1 KdD6, putative [Tetrahymena thermophila SB210]